MVSGSEVTVAAQKLVKKLKLIRVAIPILNRPGRCFQGNCLDLFSVKSFNGIGRMAELIFIAGFPAI